MQTRVFRRGGGKPAARLGGAALLMVAVVLLGVAGLPGGLRVVFGGSEAAGSLSLAARLVGVALAATLALVGLFLLRMAPYLGGLRVTVSDDGLIYMNGDAWLDVPWHEVRTIEETPTGYSVATAQGSFTFGRQIERADELAAIIRQRCRCS